MLRYEQLEYHKLAWLGHIVVRTNRAAYTLYFGIDKQNQQLKFKNWDVNKLFERTSEGGCVLKPCPFQTFLFQDYNLFD